MKNKTKKIMAGAGGLVLLVGGFFLGRVSKKIPETAVEIFRTNNQAYLVRIYNIKEGWNKSMEITEGNDASDYLMIGTKEYQKRMDFQKRNPHIKVYVKDIDK